MGPEGQIPGLILVILVAAQRSQGLKSVVLAGKTAQHLKAKTLQSSLVQPLKGQPL